MRGKSNRLTKHKLRQNPFTMMAVFLNIFTAALLAILATGCQRPSDTVPMPDKPDTSSASVVLYDESGVNVVSQCLIEDAATIRKIQERLSPAERSEAAEGLMKSGPVIGKIGMRGPRGTTWIEFVDPGMNPLCFRIGADSYIRKRATLADYRADHIRLYGIDAERVDEAMLLYDSLLEACKSKGR